MKRPALLKKIYVQQHDFGSAVSILCVTDSFFIKMTWFKGNS